MTSDATPLWTDATLQARLAERGAPRSFAEVRALLARQAWSLAPQPLDETIAYAVGDAASDPELAAQLRALRDRLAEHAQDGAPAFTLHPHTPAASGQDLVDRLLSRQTEASILLDALAVDRVLHPELHRTLAPVVGSLQRTVAALEKKRALIAAHLDAFAEEPERRKAEEAFDQIDGALAEGLTVSIRALRNAALLSRGAKVTARKAQAKGAVTAAAERRKLRRKAEKKARKKNRR